MNGRNLVMVVCLMLLLAGWPVASQPTHPLTICGVTVLDTVDKCGQLFGESLDPTKGAGLEKLWIVWATQPPPKSMNTWSLYGAVTKLKGCPVFIIQKWESCKGQ